LYETSKATGDNERCPKKPNKISEGNSAKTTSLISDELKLKIILESMKEIEPKLNQL
jgi:hypothetical protein